MNLSKQTLTGQATALASMSTLGAGPLTRLASPMALLVAELILLSMWLDTRDLRGRGGFIEGIGDYGPYILRSLVIAATVFLAFTFMRAKDALQEAGERLSGEPLDWRFLGVHAGAMGVFAVLSSLLFGNARGDFENPIAVTWLLSGVLGAGACLLFVVPWKIVQEVGRSTGPAWRYAAASALVTPMLEIASRQLWKPATEITFVLVRWLLSPFFQVVADPARAVIGSPKFTVQIAASCSGLEGMGLMLVFGTLWLWFFRSDYRFPRALLLVPFGMLLMFLFNSVRIAALVLIGNAGAESVALGGFHSQAGWIAFNSVALGLACLAHKVSWISAGHRSVAVETPRSESAVPAYLLPFLAILTAGMIAGAATGAFEWLYPLRFVAAAGTLLIFRHTYFKMDWRCGWIAPLIGGGVFVLWIALDRIAGAPGGNKIADGLATLSLPARIGWLTIRTLAAVVTVPIAEELAFRGFLLRRLISEDFESIDMRRWTLLALLGSSLIFGLMHGDRWIAGAFAGILYAGAQKWRGRIGDAVVAHGVTNALLAAWVLWGGHWSLW